MREEIPSTAHALISGAKGLLAIDESNGTCNKRFARWGIPGRERTGPFPPAYLLRAAWYSRRMCSMSTEGRGNFIFSPSRCSTTIRAIARFRNHL
jgi:fructose-bisphosphate aldolase class 1